MYHVAAYAFLGSNQSTKKAKSNVSSHQVFRLIKVCGRPSYALRRPVDENLEEQTEGCNDHMTNSRLHKSDQSVDIIGYTHHLDPSSSIPARDSTGTRSNDHYPVRGSTRDDQPVTQRRAQSSTRCRTADHTRD